MILINPIGRMITCAITDRSHYGSTEADRKAGLVKQAEYLAQNGIDFIQLREKDLNPQALLCLTRTLLNTLRDMHSRTRLLLNSGHSSRADIAAAAGAHGLHLTAGEGTITPAQARRVLHLTGRVEPVFSVSCHTLADVQSACENDADIILFGPVFGKFIDEEMVVPGTGLDLLAGACRMAGDVSVLALGGVTQGNFASCIEAGAKGVAAIRLFQQMPK